jgi:hypothetical protein
VIICFETGTVFVTKSKQRRLTRGIALFFPNLSHNFYVVEKTFRYSLNKYHYYINDPIANSGKINVNKLLPVHTCIEYYSKFGNNELPIILDYQTNINLTAHTVQLSISIEKEKQELQKQIDSYNLLISCDMSFIKDKQKEVNKNRKQVKS